MTGQAAAATRSRMGTTMSAAGWGADATGARSILILPLAVRGNGSVRTMTLRMRLWSGSFRLTIATCSRTVSSGTEA